MRVNAIDRESDVGQLLSQLLGREIDFDQVLQPVVTDIHKNGLDHFEKREPQINKNYSTDVLSKLFQKQNIVVEHQTNIVNRIHKGAHAFDAKTESKARI